MQDVLAMQGSQSLDHLNEYFPDGRLSYHAIGLLVLYNLLIQVSIVQVVHHDAQARSRVFKKGFFVTDDTCMAKNGKKQLLIYY